MSNTSKLMIICDNEAGVCTIYKLGDERVVQGDMSVHQAHQIMIDHMAAVKRNEALWQRMGKK